MDPPPECKSSPKFLASDDQSSIVQEKLLVQATNTVDIDTETLNEVSIGTNQNQSDNKFQATPVSGEKKSVTLQEFGTNAPIGSIVYCVSLDPFALFQVDFNGLFLLPGTESSSNYSRYLKRQEMTLSMRGAKKFSSFPFVQK